jgi:signal peptidase I
MASLKKLFTSGQQKFLKETGVFILDILYNAVIIVLLVVLIRTFLISPFRVIGSSMADTLHNSEFILINKLSYRLWEPGRGDPIVFKPPITNKYPQKFERTVKTDASGMATLDLKDLHSAKQSELCKKALIQKFWFCQESAALEDLVYFRPSDASSFSDAAWRTAQKQSITSQDLATGTLVLKALPSTVYDVRIYDHAGPEFFVKRIIGIPGDTIKIENGRVYLKKPGELVFTEIDEPYLNAENRFQTFFPQKLGTNEFTVPAGHYFTLGDNRNHSNDSRSWFSPIDQSFTPFVSKSDISGRVLIVLWPLLNLRLIPSANL